MSPLNLSLTDLIQNVDQDLSGSPALDKITEALARSHTLGALGDQLVSHYVAIAKNEGASWTEIGDAIGVSKQAAQQRHSPKIFNRYTDFARHSVVLAQEAARARKHDYIGTEHLLLGVLDEPRGLGSKILAAEAGSADAVRAALRARMHEDGDKAQRGHIPFTPRGRKALEQATAEAEALGHDFVGTEHILLGVAAVPQGIADLVLTDLGLPVARLRELVADEVARLLAERGD
jgi:hypothetical protein